MDDTTQFWRDPALPYAESRRACYRPHSHPTFSIGAVDEGASVFTGASGGPVGLRPGTLVFVPPQRVHACNPEPDREWSYQMLHLDVQWYESIRRENGLYAAHADEPVWMSREPAFYAGFCRLNGLLFSDAGPHEKEIALIEFVAECDAQAGHRIPLVSARGRRDRLAPVLDALQSADMPPRSLSELAALAGMSRYQLIRAFRAETGLTPHAWQLDQRVSQARERLRAGQPLAEVAYGLGFADQSHFQRVFKGHVGVTPGSYRR